jgi:hypothetical protein
MVHAVFYKKEAQVRIYLWFYMLLALITIPVFLTGDPSQDLIVNLPGINKETIDRHETFGYISLITILLLGVIAGAGIRYFKNTAILPKWFKNIFLAVAFISVLAISWTGKTGGEIRHSELTTSVQNLK